MIASIDHERDQASGALNVPDLSLPIDIIIHGIPRLLTSTSSVAPSTAPFVDLNISGEVYPVRGAEGARWIMLILSHKQSRSVPKA